MNIERLDLTVRDLVAGYHDNRDGGVIGYSGKLDIRPPYQREFIYDNKKRDAVLNTVVNNFPLNAMYWSDKGDGTYEIIDGQQRTISIAQYVEEQRFSIEIKPLDMPYTFDGLPSNVKERILNYKPMVYVCTGTDEDKINWFTTINIAGMVQTKQELRSAVYAGPWVTDAKRYFCRQNTGAHGRGKNYLSGAANRQAYLETVLKWISNDDIENYMAEHRFDEDATELWHYFEDVIDWVEKTFTEYYSSMKGVDWGGLYNVHKDDKLDPIEIAAEVERLLDEVEENEIQRESGIYPYILTGDEKHLNLRQFDKRTKERVYREQNGCCKICGKPFDISMMEADHKDPWAKGGKTKIENCQVLCKKCNGEKSDK